ncbi:CD160 antigen isoform X2 [Rousettus aegyptiacus]|uniref:CD160 molecule n=1 Tax=Rousettus aegyptiacus TaxID=9407 RepID=A0A7J8BC73_ROUAE|nr:CD160 antigen isoform X2 [Rousettus aegyptiacus]KAF6396318.1 CD160 molecule [Rousettus aegyptiacus]
MVPGGGCCALAALLVIADIRLGGCMNIISSASQEGERLSLICTVWHKEREAEGLVVFLCKNRTRDCSPETSLQQLRLKRYRGPDGGRERSSQLVFTIDRATPANSGVYQCCARSQRPDIHLQGHFWSLSVTETGNYTLTGPKETGRRALGHSKGALSSGFRQEKLWAMLVTSLVALQAL